MKTIRNSIRSIAASGVLVITSLQAQTIDKITGFHHIESVASDGSHLYLADIGKELDPSGKDGDGKIIKVDFKGKIIDSNCVNEKLNAPKGLAINNGMLFAADVDRLIAIELKSGNKLYEIDFSSVTTFLNDITVADNTTLFVSATDKSKIFKVNLSNKSYSELSTDKLVPGTNGLFYDGKSNRLYINGFGSDSKPNGTVGYIDLSTNTFKSLATIEGYFDGIWLHQGTLYTSNWVAFEKKGILYAIDIATAKVKEVKLKEAIAGPADFIISRNQIIIPEMMAGAVLFIPVK